MRQALLALIWSWPCLDESELGSPSRRRQRETSSENVFLFIVVAVFYLCFIFTLPNLNGGAWTISLDFVDGIRFFLRFKCVSRQDSKVFSLCFLGELPEILATVAVEGLRFHCFVCGGRGCFYTGPTGFQHTLTGISAQIMERTLKKLFELVGSMVSSSYF